MARRLMQLGMLLVSLALAAPAASQPTNPPAPESETEPDGDAQPKDDVTRAREHAQRSLDHLEAGRHAEALDEARLAEGIYHAPIHLRVMGEALEGLGRRAEAAAVYDRLAAEPLPSTAHPLFVTAQETARARLKVLSAKLPSLLIEIAGVPADAATVTVDGRPFDSGADVAVRMDPGDHRVRVSAPDRLPFDEIVALKEGAGVVIVTARMRKPGQPESDDPFVETVPPPDDGIAPPPVTSWVLLGVGTAALVAGGVTGGIALSKAGDLEERCPDKRCPPSAEPDHEEAEIFGWTSTVALGVGVAAVAAAAVVWFVDMADDADTARLEVGPGTIGARVRF